ncbi:hypothetical protein Chor_000805 [Crotalus horridus]
MLKNLSIFQVGVHIADVSHFIRPGNALDQESAKRGTTVYLCEKRIDMVPDLLSSNLCSLRSNMDRLAFSCIWEMNQNAEILATRFTKSVINSKSPATDDLLGSQGFAPNAPGKAECHLALTLSSPEVRFHIDSETHDPIDLQTKELNKRGLGKGLEIKTDSAKSLADSLDRVESSSFPYLNTLIRILATRCMMQAVYFCSGMDSDFHHYGLASPIYTHFTSPIRRYADIIVHRLLAVAIGVDSTYPELTDKHKLADLCKNLNYRHKMAHEEAYILFVRKNAIVVLIPKYGLEGTVFFEEKAKAKEGLIKVSIVLDSSNVQHQKIRMMLVEPKILGYSRIAAQSSGNKEPEMKKKKLGK